MNLNKMKKKIDLKLLNPVYDLDIRPYTSYSPVDFFTIEGFRSVHYNLDYDVVLDNGVKLQRDYVWNLQQQQALIVGMLCGTKLPPFYMIVYRDERHNIENFKVVDGKQRLTTIERYINNEFGIPFEGELYYFSDLDNIQQYVIACYDLSVYVVYEYHDDKIGDEGYVKLFKFVNFGGTQQEIKHMDMLENSLNK